MRPLLRDGAYACLAFRIAKINKDPLPGGADVAFLGHVIFRFWDGHGRLCRGRRLAGAEHRAPAPARADARSVGRIGDAARLLQNVEAEISSAPDHDDRETGRQECAHGQLLESPPKLPPTPHTFTPRALPMAAAAFR